MNHVNINFKLIFSGELNHFFCLEVFGALQNLKLKVR